MEEVKQHLKKWDEDDKINPDAMIYLKEALKILVEKVEVLEQQVKRLSEE